MAKGIRIVLDHEEGDQGLPVYLSFIGKGAGGLCRTVVAEKVIIMKLSSLHRNETLSCLKVEINNHAVLKRPYSFGLGKRLISALCPVTCVSKFQAISSDNVGNCTS